MLNSVNSQDNEEEDAEEKKNTEDNYDVKELETKE